MPTEPIFIIGAGGHAKVVIDALLAAGVAPDALRLADNDAARAGRAVLGVAVACPAVRPEMAGGLFHIAIGSAAARARLHQQLLALGARPLTIIHPRAAVAASAILGEGVFVAAHAVIGPDARVGCCSIVNHGAIVDHDCQVGAYAHIAPNATLGGAVQVGQGALVGAGATILPGLHTGAASIVGAGAVLTTSAAASQTWAGVPAVLFSKDPTSD